MCVRVRARAHVPVCVSVCVCVCGLRSAAGCAIRDGSAKDISHRDTQTLVTKGLIAQHTRLGSDWQPITDLDGE